jgi:hypothetical protein
MATSAPAYGKASGLAWFTILEGAMNPTVQSANIPVRYEKQGSVSIASYQYRQHLVQKLERFQVQVAPEFPAPSGEVVEIVRQLIGSLHVAAVTDLDVFPSARGGIACAFSTSEKFAQLEVLNKGQAVIALGNPVASPIISAVESSDEALSSAIETIRSYMAE